MTKQEFINACHTAQADAGTEIKFNEILTKAQENIGRGMMTRQVDPVASFVATLLFIHDDNIERVKEDMQYYFDELQRVVNNICND